MMHERGKDLLQLQEQALAGLVAVGVHVEGKTPPDLPEGEEGLQAVNAVYVGDSDVDIATANNAGIPCISVLWGFRDRDFLLQHGATTFIKTPSELL